MATALHLKFKIEAHPYVVWSFRCPNCNALVIPATLNDKGMVPCFGCGYKFYRQSFDKKAEGVANLIEKETGAKVLKF